MKEEFTVYQTMLNGGPAVSYRFVTEDGVVFQTIAGSLDEARRYRDGWLHDYGYEPDGRIPEALRPAGDTSSRRIMAMWCTAGGHEYQIAGPFESELDAARYAVSRDIYSAGSVVVQRLETFFDGETTDWVCDEVRDAGAIVGGKRRPKRSLSMILAILVGSGEAEMTAARGPAR